MSNADQFDVREIRPGCWRLEFPFNGEFIEYLKQRVPWQDRSYDSATHFWEIRDANNKYMAAIEGVGVQKFTYATRIFWREGKQVIRNLQSGHESIQENLF
jgi:hypothetical protein